MNYFDHLQKTFALEHLPANVRVSRFMGRWPFVRRYQNIPVGLGLLPSEGGFLYRGPGEPRQIKFNGRNLQFHALYENHYRYGYELETALLIACLCRGKTPFFDVGSNWGYFSLLTASLPEFSGPIYAFEPNPGTFADLTRTIQQAALQDRITPCNIGVGSVVCDLVVAETDRFNTGLSRLTAAGNGRKIPVKPLDLLDFKPPGLIKVDAEGMELEILKGASKILADARPFVILENFLDFQAPQKTYETMTFLEQKEYRVFVPVLEFSLNGSNFLATYGRDYTPLVAQGGQPRLGVVEVSTRLRFLLGDQLNLLAVHSARVPELWAMGLADFGKI